MAKLQFWVLSVHDGFLPKEVYVAVMRHVIQWAHIQSHLQKTTEFHEQYKQCSCFGTTYGTTTTGSREAGIVNPACSIASFALGDLALCYHTQTRKWWQNKDFFMWDCLNTMYFLFRYNLYFIWRKWLNKRYFSCKYWSPKNLKNWYSRVDLIQRVSDEHIEQQNTWMKLLEYLIVIKIETL